MKVRRLHNWNVTPRRAAEIQLELRTHGEGKDRLGRIRFVAGADVAFVLNSSQSLRKSTGFPSLRKANRAIAGVVVYRYPEMQEVERASAVVRLRFPYVPGLLSFREMPALLAAFRKLKHAPDLIFCDGHGYAHPRRFGLACHLGLALDRPTIGCAKSILTGTPGQVADKAGSSAPLRDDRNGEVIGAALRTRSHTGPIFVSQGHRVSLATAIRLVLSVCDGKRIPRPTRDADRFVRQRKEKRIPRVAR